MFKFPQLEYMVLFFDLCPDREMMGTVQCFLHITSCEEEYKIDGMFPLKGHIAILSPDSLSNVQCQGFILYN